MRIYLGAFGDPGHAFPMIALGSALVERGHEVALDTWRKWREPVEAAGMTFTAAPEYQVFPTPDKPLKPYAAAVRAAREIQPFVHGFAPDIAVADILTPGPALAAELEDVPLATLVPHVHPFVGDGHPIYSIGARLPRTRFGRELWRWGNRRFVEGSLETGRDQYNETRARLGLAPLPYVHTALSRELTMVGTLPQLEYPRRWEPWVRVVGPLQWEPPGERVEPPPGSGPVVLIAPSTSQDPSHSLLRASLAGLADAPVRVIATYNGREPSSPIDVPGNARARAVAVVLEDDAAVRRGGVARRPRDARAGAGRRLLRGRLPGGRRHERERRAGGLGRPRGAAPGAVAGGAVAAAGGGAGAAAGGAGAAWPRSRLGGRRTTGPRTASEELEAWAAEPPLTAA